MQNSLNANFSHCKKAKGVLSKFNSFKGSKLWKLENNKLQNKAFPDMSILKRYPCNKWNFKTKDDLIYIENSIAMQVLEATSNFYVLLEDFEEDKAEQLWKKGEPDAEGYFTLENSKVAKVMTASFGSFISYSLEIKGKITFRQIFRLNNSLFFIIFFFRYRSN